MSQFCLKILYIRNFKFFFKNLHSYWNYNFCCRTTPLQNGTTLPCLHYEGQICRDIFSTNLSSLSSLPRLHSSEQNSVESVLQFAITAINQLVTHHECSVAMTIALCHYTMQLCSSNNSVTAHFCTSECNDLYVKCGQFILQLEEYVNNIPRDEEFSFPRCFELNNASEFRVSSNETCTKLGLGQYKTILCIIVSFIRSTTPQLSAWNHLLCIIVTLSLLMFKHSCLRRNEEVGSLRKRAALSSSSNLAWFQKQKKIGPWGESKEQRKQPKLHKQPKHTSKTPRSSDQEISVKI